MLCGDRGVVMALCLCDDENEAPALLRTALAKARPVVTLVSMAPKETLAKALAAEVRPRSVAWLRDPKAGPGVRKVLDEAKVPSFHTEALSLPLGPDGVTPTVAGYAGWAGALWRWLK